MTVRARATRVGWDVRAPLLPGEQRARGVVPTQIVVTQQSYPYYVPQVVVSIGALIARSWACCVPRNCPPSQMPDAEASTAAAWRRSRGVATLRTLRASLGDRRQAVRQNDSCKLYRILTKSRGCTLISMKRSATLQLCVRCLEEEEEEVPQELPFSAAPLAADTDCGATHRISARQIATSRCVPSHPRPRQARSPVRSSGRALLRLPARLQPLPPPVEPSAPAFISPTFRPSSPRPIAAPLLPGAGRWKGRRRSHPL